jgi:phenylalanyl-tRNA synthetase beta chain
VDIEREADLVEEIARFYGYDKIPSEFPPLQKLEPLSDPARKRKDKMRELLFHQGYDEFVNFSFFDPEKEILFPTEKKAIQIRNPISSKASALRTTLLAGLLENVLWNKNRGAEGVHAFEIGNTYYWEKERIQEQLSLAIITTGLLEAPQWQGKRERTDFFRLKGICEFLTENLRYKPYDFQQENHPFFEQEYSLSLNYKGERFGCLGLLKRDILDSYSLEDEVWAAELDLQALFERQPQSFRFSPVAKYPGVFRDVSFIADRSIAYQKIKEEIDKIGIPYLEKFDLYDIFSGSSVPKGKISLSLRFIFRHPQRTLLAEEVDKFQERIIKTLKTRFNFQLREGGKIDK